MKLQAEYPGIIRWLIDGCLDISTVTNRTHRRKCQAFFYYGRKPDRFADVFRQFGLIVMSEPQPFV
jgi:hypothetical protein